jgi:hypothetical protein
MSTVLPLSERFTKVIIPTRTQVLGSLFLSLLILAPTQSHTLLVGLGLPSDIVSAGQTQFSSRFDNVLNSTLVAQFALITFWAVVGLVTYLVCWGAYNIFIEARNEVTLNTAYTNRGHKHSPYRLLSFKAAAAVGLALAIGALRYSFSLSVALASRFSSTPGLATSVWAVLAIVSLAVELYLIFIFVQLTFTPWYRAIDAEESFTES